MALITKSTIASVIGIADALIPSSVYSWAKFQLFAKTGLKETATAKTYRKMIGGDTNILKLPDRDIKEITTITIDGVEQTFILNTSLKLNPDTGFLIYTDGFSSGSLVEIEYEINAYTSTEIMDYLITLLVIKGLNIFTPQNTNQVESIKIGRYSKNFGSVDSSLSSFLETLDTEINQVIGLIKGDDGSLQIGGIN